MSILSGDIKLLKSAVMADVPEGGGAPTANVIPDAVSNSIFPDISELDRAGGRVNLRKVHVSIQTDDTDTFFGGNVIVAEPFADPRVAATLFSTENVFDTRVQAQSRVESYLNKGPEWGGFLYENHIAGQRAVQLFQRVGSELPRVGQTLVIAQNEGLGNQKEQYVRVTKVSQVERTFTYNVDSDYQAWVVTLDISDALRQDYTGTSANRQFVRATNAALIRDTLVADAGSYYGSSRLTQAAQIGDFSIEAESIYTQLVPSAQTETPLVDVSLTQSTLGYNPSGDVIVQTLNMIFSTTQSIYVGGGILPGSLTVDRGGVVLTDAGGVLYSGASQVGLVDYENGVLSLSTNVYGTNAGLHTVTYTPAVGTRMIGSSIGEYVTAENRSLSKVYPLPEVPAPMSLSVSYQVNSRWYVLREDGTGALRGNDASYGAGTLNRTTGTVVVTFGALPDVGSAIIYQWLPGLVADKYPLAEMSFGAKVFHQIILTKPNPVPETIVITWDHGGAKTASVDASGTISGDATGVVRGRDIYLSPNAIPAKGTEFSVAYDHRITDNVATDLTAGNRAVTDQGTEWRLTFAEVTGDLQSGEIEFSALSPFSLVNGVQQSWGLSQNLLMFHGGKVYIAANRFVPPIEAGTVGTNYIEFAKTFAALVPVMVTDTIPQPVGDLGDVVVSTSSMFTQVNGTHQTASGGLMRVLTGRIFSGIETIASAVDTYTSDALRLYGTTGFGELSAIRFTFASETYADSYLDDALYKNVSTATGLGEAVGTIVPAQGVVNIENWAAGANPAVTNWSASLVPPTAGINAPYNAAFVVLRTAAAPLRPSSMTISGTMLDGTAFTATADAAGQFNHARVKGRLNVEAGVAEVYFVHPTTGPEIDLSFLGISGLTTAKASLVNTSTLKYNAVAYTYLPLDADILGLDPVRLPSDGKVPVFRLGGFAVVGHTGSITATVSNGQTIDCGRVRLSRVRVLGDNGSVINTGYTADLETGTVSFVDVSGYSQPVTIQHRVEDMAVVSDAQISGLITFTRPLTHDYPASSVVSSALITGDLFARVSTVFDQATWTNVWSDTVIGSVATATFNNTAYPIAVTNRGALTERWVIRFTGSTSFEVIGENVGVIAVGNTSTDCAPNNPATGVPYFTIPALGWGSGWATGNVLRFNTIGAGYPVWVVRTIQQGPETVPDDTFALLVRGDVDTP